jgi:hypothetical protein
VSRDQAQKPKPACAEECNPKRVAYFGEAPTKYPSLRNWWSSCPAVGNGRKRTRNDTVQGAIVGSAPAAARKQESVNR